MRRLTDLLWKQLPLSLKAECSCTAPLYTVADTSDPVHVLLRLPQPSSDVEALLQFAHLGDRGLCVPRSPVPAEGA